MAKKKSDPIEKKLDNLEGTPELQDGEAGESGDVTNEPSYKVIGDSKIPVSRAYGSLWKMRRAQAKKIVDDLGPAWDEAIAYYKHAQDEHRIEDNGGGLVSGSNFVRKRRNAIITETENIVFANISVMVPALYAKSPDIEVTCNNDEYKELANTGEVLVNSLFYRKHCPGINLKPKARKCVVNALLTNEAYIVLGWEKREGDTQRAQEDLIRLSEELQKAKDIKRVREIEGEIKALEVQTQILLPPGPWARVRRGSQVFIDPECQCDDLSDATWIMYYDFMPTATLRAIYGSDDEEAKDGDKFVSKYKPTHKIGANMNMGHLDYLVDNTLFQPIEEDDKTEKWEEVTKVWYIWDRATKRLFLYHDLSWKWPIWVWDDPYGLEEFFPIYRLSFHTDPTNIRSKGEVSYYLDQVDALGEINDAEARARQMLKRNPMYNKTAIPKEEDAEKIIKGDDGTIVGIDLPEGMKIDDVFGTPVPEVVKFRQLFDETAKQSKLQSIDRISSVSDVMRGAQFKTNTTNDAIEKYNSLEQQRIDDRIDAIEDFIAQIGWGLLQLCLRFMQIDQVAMLVGKQRASSWTNLTPEQIKSTFGGCRVEGGSTSKPTSMAKKQEAMQMAQILSQFGRAAPIVMLKVLELFERSFDGFVMRDTDWAEIKQNIMMQAQRGDSTGANAQGGEQGQPDVEAMVQEAVSKGVPENVARKEIEAKLKQQGGSNA